MSVSSKYASCPGIAFDQPDLYESSNELDLLPRFESPVNFLFDSQLDENIKLVDIDAKQAFKVFEKSDIGGADFEELIGYKTPNHVYDQSSLSSSKQTDLNHELIFQKYQRLEKESQHLITKLKTIKSKGQQNQDFGQSINPQAMITSLQTLQSQLKNNIDDDLMIDSKDVIDFNKVIKSIESIESIDTNDSIDSRIRSKNSISSQIMPQSLASTNPIDMLERRIYHLEILLNCDQDKIEFINGFTNGSSLTESVNFLNTRVGLLNISNLEQINARVILLLSKLSKVIERKNDIDIDTQRKAKINKLFEDVSKAEKNMFTICDLTSRLNISSNKQEQVLHFAEQLWNLDNLQSKLESGVKSNQQQFKLLEENFSTKMESIKLLLNNIDERIKTLTK